MENFTPNSLDSLKRKLVIARPNTDKDLSHIGLVGDTYTILLSGDDTGGRYCLIDMHIPPGGGGLENFPANRVNKITPAAWFARR